MSSLCGADCRECAYHENCRGCSETCGKPFGGRCIAAEYIRAGGMQAYNEFKSALKDEINALLGSLEIPGTDALYELAGSFVNLEYTLPNGEKVRLLDDKNIYLGCQIELEGIGVCCGVAADASFILISSYGVDGSEPEIILYKKR